MFRLALRPPGHGLASALVAPAASRLLFVERFVSQRLSPGEPSSPMPPSLPLLPAPATGRQGRRPPFFAADPTGGESGAAPLLRRRPDRQAPPLFPEREARHARAGRILALALEENGGRP